MAMLTMRYDPAFRAARRVLAEGGLGEPALLTVQKSYPLQGWDGAAAAGLLPPALHLRRHHTLGRHPCHRSHPLVFRVGPRLPWAPPTPAWVTAEIPSAGSWKAPRPAIHAGIRGARHGPPGLPAAPRSRPAGRRIGHARRIRSTLGRRPPAGRLHPGHPRGPGRARVVEGPDGIRESGAGTGPPLFAAFLDWVEKGDAMALTTEDCLRAAEAALRARDAADQGRVLEF